MPLLLGHAISINRSQGLTLRRLTLHLEDCNQPGQAYTALSRAPDPKEVSVKSRPKRFLASPEVYSFMDGLFNLRKQRDQDLADFDSDDDIDPSDYDTDSEEDEEMDADDSIAEGQM